MVLFSTWRSNEMADNLIPETMIKIRTRDKYVVVKEAPWQVYD